MKQQEVADILGIKPNTLSNWEKGRTEPDIDTFVKLCDIYEIDCASLLADVYTFKRIKSDISLSEYDIIKKYRGLDAHGKKAVETVLNNEDERCHEFEHMLMSGALTIFDIFSDTIEDRDKHIRQLSSPEAAEQIIDLLNKRDEKFGKPLGVANNIVNAAHADEKIKNPTSEMLQEEERIMDDDNF